jgi:hypothetical protein
MDSGCPGTLRPRVFAAQPISIGASQLAARGVAAEGVSAINIRRSATAANRGRCEGWKGVDKQWAGYYQRPS